MISPQALYAAKMHLQGVPDDQMLPAIGTVLGKYPNMSLVQLIAAHKALTAQKEQDETQRVTGVANQGGGMQQQAPAPTTVAQDTIGQLSQVDPSLEQQIMSRAAQPAREGGIAGLDAGRLGEEYATGGIVAFRDNKDQPVRQDMPTEDEMERENRIHAMGAGLFGGVKAAATPLAMGYDLAQGIAHPFREAAYTLGLSEKNPEYKSATKSLWEDDSMFGLYPPSKTTTPAAPATAPATPTDTQYSTLPPGTRNPVGIQQGTPQARARVAAGPAATESDDSSYNDLITRLNTSSDEGLKLLRSGIRVPETPKKAGEYAASEKDQENAYLKARGLPTAEESMKERLDKLAATAVDARNNRDTDRWMAAAQGFFAMGAGKSQYAMQNMAEGLGIGTKELKAVEQDYRKVDQLQKDKAELLKEVTRQEARGDYSKGNALRKEAEDRNDKINAANVSIGERMTSHADTALGNAISAKGARDARRDAELARISAAQGQNNYVNMLREQGLAETERRNKATEDQRYADMQARLRDRHPLMTKGTLPNKLTELSDAKLRLATAPTKPEFIQNVNNLTAEVDRMQEQVANDTAKDAKRFVKAGNSEWGTLQTTGGKK